LYDCGKIPSKAFERLTRHAEALHRPELRFAFLSDRKLDERQRGISIEAAYHGFVTGSRRLNIIDVPGHRDFMKNAISGIAAADASILVLDAQHTSTHGLAPQTKESLVLLAAFGISPVLVVVNKMDLVGFSSEAFELAKLEVENAWGDLFSQDVLPASFIPVSALAGDNLIHHSNSMPWYKGDTLLNELMRLPIPPRLIDGPLRMPILRTCNVRGVGPVVTGKIETGSLAIGDRVAIVPYPEQGSVQAEVKSIESQHEQVHSAQAGDDVGIVLAKQDKHFTARLVKKGHMLAAPSHLPAVVKRFLGEIRVVDHPSGVGSGYAPVLHVHQVAMSCRIASIVRVIGPNDETRHNDGEPRIRNGETGLAWIESDRPLVIAPEDEDPRLGRFVLRDGRTVAMGRCCVIASDRDQRRFASFRMI
jgi:elongation factor 1-alpha